MIKLTAKMMCLTVITFMLSLANNTLLIAADNGRTETKNTQFEKEAAISFVSQHHPDLVRILRELEKSSPKEHTKAIRELHQAKERIAKFRERYPARYKLELGLWKAKSRSQLLAAQIQMADSEDLRSELRTVLRNKADLQLELLKYERVQAEKRLERIDTSISKLENSKEESIEKWIQNVVRSRANRKIKNASEKKPVSKKTKPAQTSKTSR